MNSLSRSFSHTFSLFFLTQNRVVPCCFLFSSSLSISAHFHTHFHAHFCIEFCKNSAHFLIHFSHSLSLTFSLFPQILFGGFSHTFSAQFLSQFHAHILSQSLLTLTLIFTHNLQAGFLDSGGRNLLQKL